MKHTKKKAILWRSLGLLLSLLLLAGILTLAVFATEEVPQPTEGSVTEKDSSAPKGDTKSFDNPWPGLVHIEIKKRYECYGDSKPKRFEIAYEYKDEDGTWKPINEENGFWVDGYSRTELYMAEPLGVFIIRFERLENVTEPYEVRFYEKIPAEPDGVLYDPRVIEAKISFDSEGFSVIDSMTRDGLPFDPLMEKDHFINTEVSYVTEVIYKSHLSQGDKPQRAFSFVVEAMDSDGKWYPLPDSLWEIVLLEEPSIDMKPPYEKQPVKVQLAFDKSDFGVEKATIRIREEADPYGTIVTDTSECIMEIVRDENHEYHVVSRTQNGKPVDSFHFINRNVSNVMIRKYAEGAFAGNHTGRSYQFKLTATPPEGHTGPLYEPSKEDAIDENGFFYLKDGEYLILYSVPYGTTFTIVETEVPYCTTTAAVELDNGIQRTNQSSNPREIKFTVTDPDWTRFIFTNSFDTEPSVELTINKDFIGSRTKLGLFELIMERWDGSKWVNVSTSGSPHFGGNLYVALDAGQSASTTVKLYPDPNQQGEAKFRIREKIGGEKDVRYDPTIYTFSVVKGSDGIFRIENLSSGIKPAMEIRFKNYTAHSITVKKQISGNMSDPLTPFFFKVEVLDVPYVEGDPYVASGVSSWSGNYELYHGDVLTLSNLPYGTKLRITEAETDEYSTTVTVNVGGKETTSKTNVTEITVGAESIAITYNNHFSTSIDTGVVLDTLPYVLILAVVAVGGFFFLRTRRKDED